MQELFDDSFFEDEVRDGFYVPSMVKKAWAAELTVLGEIDKVCEKYNIRYIVGYGTMLGAVRHGGFIPWDDDLDIIMRREDYERFLAVAGEALPEGYAVLNIDNTEDYWYFVARVASKSRICFEEEHLERFHGFPYIVGVDIFVLDVLSSDEEKEQQRDLLVQYILATADSLGSPLLSPDKLETALRTIEQKCGVKIDRRLEVAQCKKRLYQVAQKIFKIFNDDKTGKIARLMPDVIYDGAKGFPCSWYRDTVRIQFENTKIPVPVMCNEMLYNVYGEYMVLKRDCGGHEYPFFQSQKEQLERVLGYELPRYRYPGGSNGNAGNNTEDVGSANGRDKARASSFKVTIKEHIKALRCFIDSVRTQEVAGAMDALFESQRVAIELGTLIEQVRGEGQPSVHGLEQYCEIVFEGYQEMERMAAIQNSQDAGELRNVSVSGGTQETSIDDRPLRDSVSGRMSEQLDAIESTIQETIMKHREVVFLPFDGKYWGAFHTVWEAARQDEDTDVYVVPLPYYYKGYDGGFRNMKYDTDGYPDAVRLTDYTQFDLELHHPDIIFIQNPYDEYNSAISIPKEFYSAKIRDYTEKLVYIPYFITDEFEKDSYREYWNMQYYCNMPGVVNADKVIVQSEKMRQLYIDKLTEFAGEDTRGIWEDKIEGTGSPLQDGLESAGYGYFENRHNIFEKQDGTRKKIILYYIGMGSLIRHGDAMIGKIGRVLDDFAEYGQDIAVIWKADKMILANRSLVGEKLYLAYIKLTERFAASDYGIYTGEVRDELLVAMGDAYYGDFSHLAQMVQDAGKPVMIWDVDV